jgi:hypothetical protein
MPFFYILEIYFFYVENLNLVWDNFILGAFTKSYICFNVS